MKLYRGHKKAILSYHRVMVDVDRYREDTVSLSEFKNHIAFISRFCDIVSLEELLSISSNELDGKLKVALTFDDGYRDAFLAAKDVLYEKKLSATFFLSTASIGGEPLWNDCILEAVRRFEGSRLDLRSLGLGDYTFSNSWQRRFTAKELIAELKYWDYHRRKQAVREIVNRSELGDIDSQIISESEVRWLVDHGFSVGAHTMSHPILNKLDDSEAIFEIEEGKRKLEAITGSRVRYFAYPNGKPGKDFSEKHVGFVKEAGFSGAVSTVDDFVRESDDIYMLPRLSVWSSGGLRLALRLILSNDQNVTYEINKVEEMVREVLNLPGDVPIELKPNQRRYSTVWEVTLVSSQAMGSYFVKLATDGAEKEYQLWQQAESRLSANQWYQCLKPTIDSSKQFLISRASELDSIESQIAKDGFPNPLSWFRNLRGSFSLAGKCLRVFHSESMSRGAVQDALFSYISNRAQVLDHIGLNIKDDIEKLVAGLGEVLITTTHGDFAPGNVLTNGKTISLVDFGIREWDQMTPLWDLATMLVSLERESSLRRQSPLYWNDWFKNCLASDFLRAYGLTAEPSSTEWFLCCFARHLAAFSGLPNHETRQAKWHLISMRNYLAKAKSAKNASLVKVNDEDIGS